MTEAPKPSEERSPPSLPPDSSSWSAALWSSVRDHQSVFWRQAIRAGVEHGPDAFVRLSPPVIGAVFAAVLRDHRAAVLRNLRRARGPQGVVSETLDVVRTFSTYATCLTDSFVANCGRGRLRLHVVGDSYYRDAAAAGRGVLLATAHTGGWHAAGPALAGFGDRDVLMVMRKEADAEAQAIQDDGLFAAGVRTIRIGDDPLGALPVLHHLRDGGIVALQVDRAPPGSRTIDVRFLGERFAMPLGPLRLAAVSGAPIVASFAHRSGHQFYELELAPPIHVARRSPDGLQRAAQQLSDHVESFVRRYPTQWFHFG